MRTSLLVLLSASVGIASMTSCVITTKKKPPPPPEQYVPPTAVGLADRRAETYAAAPPSRAQFRSADIFLPGSHTRSRVVYEDVGGMAIMEGDIVLGPVSRIGAMYGAPRSGNSFAGGLAPGSVKKAVSTSSASHLWPGGVLPYEVDGTVTPEKRGMIDWAVAHVTAESVLTLRPRTAADKDYLVFTEQGGNYGCSSYVGRIGGPQEVRVSGCGVKGSVVHEIGHASGLYHEQSRPDRDGFVSIAWNEISPGHEEWFKKRDGANEPTPYDYASIMHYSRKAFSKSGNDTIIPHSDANIGQREGLSTLDKAGLAQMYSGSDAGGATPPSTPPAASSGFAGTYSSNRGDVSCTESGATVNCSYPGGTLACSANGSQLDCAWFGGGQGRATFTQDANGNLNGTFGSFLSNNDQGAWNLQKTGGAPPAGGQQGGQPPAGQPGIPTLPGLPPIPTTLPQGLPPFQFPQTPPSQ